MADIGEMLGKILEDPKSLETVMGLLGGLSDTSDPHEQAPPEKGAPDMEKLIKAAGVLRQGDDERCTLLLSLRPFVSAERQNRIDQSVKMLKLLKIAEQVGGLDLV